MSKGIAIQILSILQVFNLSQSGAIREGTLCNIRAGLTQFHIGQLIAVNESILTNGFSGRHINLLQSSILNEGIIPNGYHLRQVNILQGNATSKCILRDLGDGIIQNNISHFTAICKRILTDGSSRSKVDLLDLRTVVSVHILTFLANGCHCHAVIQADVIDIARESIITNGNSLGQVDILQVGVVVEGHVSDLSIFAQGDLLQTGSTGERILSNHSVIAYGQRGQAGSKLIIEILLTILVVIADDERIILINRERKIADGNIITDHRSLQVHALAKHALRQDHVIGNVDRNQIGVRERVVADRCISGHLRQTGNSSLKEAVLADQSQLTQIDSLQCGRRTEAILPYYRHAGKINSRHSDVVRERTLTNRGNSCSTNILGSKFTSEGRSNSDQASTVSRQNIVGRLYLISLISGENLERLNRCGTECEGANIIDVGTNSDLCKAIALIEHTLRQDRGIHIEGLQRLTPGKGICTVLDLLRSNGHIL